MNENVEATSLLIASESSIFDNENNTPFMYACKYNL